jgi:queuine/archaeosine tRNA-ribosyltransferase
MVNSSYNISMNKRAKKRIKEAIEKGNLERDKAHEEKKHPASNDNQQRRGFLPKPAKKRG